MLMVLIRTYWSSREEREGGEMGDLVAPQNIQKLENFRSRFGVARVRLQGSRAVDDHQAHN